MASKRYDPTKVTVYPDHSTISAVFMARRSQADAADYVAYLPLRDWLERVARDANHQWADTQGWSDERKRQETAANIRRSLWERAAEADKRLTARADVAYAKKQRSLREVQAGLIELYERDPKTMPLFRVIQRFNEGANAHVERGQVVDGQPSKRLRDTLLSAFGDWLHLMGAAYCDVFTCDGIVSGWLADVRNGLGLPRQLAVRGYLGGSEAFVRDLMATFP
jgi:hypothetical protein